MPKDVPPQQIFAQIAEAKAYAFSCFVSSVGDANQAVAYHYLRGKLTYVYHGKPGKPLTEFVIYRGLNVFDLMERAKADFGINWIGGINSRTGVPPDYGIPASAWKTSVKKPGR